MAFLASDAASYINGEVLVIDERQVGERQLLGDEDRVLLEHALVLVQPRNELVGCMPRRELVRRALGAVHGVDLNPYAVAVARSRACSTARGLRSPAHATASVSTTFTAAIPGGTDAATTSARVRSSSHSRSKS